MKTTITNDSQIQLQQQQLQPSLSISPTTYTRSSINSPMPLSTPQPQPQPQLQQQLQQQQQQLQQPSLSLPPPATPTGSGQTSSAGLITKDKLKEYYSMPIQLAAGELGICTTMLKQICRKLGIQRWPHRKIQSLNSTICQLETTLARSDLSEELRQVRREELAVASAKKAFILERPDAEVDLNSNKIEKIPKELKDFIVFHKIEPAFAMLVSPPPSSAIPAFSIPSSPAPSTPAQLQLQCSAARYQPRKQAGHHHVNLPIIPCAVVPPPASSVPVLSPPKVAAPLISSPSVGHQAAAQPSSSSSSSSIGIVQPVVSVPSVLSINGNGSSVGTVFQSENEYGTCKKGAKAKKCEKVNAPLCPIPVVPSFSKGGPSDSLKRSLAKDRSERAGSYSPVKHKAPRFDISVTPVFGSNPQRGEGLESEGERDSELMLSKQQQQHHHHQQHSSHSHHSHHRHHHGRHHSRRSASGDEGSEESGALKLGSIEEYASELEKARKEILRLRKECIYLKKRLADIKDDYMVVDDDDDEDDDEDFERNSGKSQFKKSASSDCVPFVGSLGGSSLCDSMKNNEKIAEDTLTDWLRINKGSYSSSSSSTQSPRSTTFSVSPPPLPLPLSSVTSNPATTTSSSSPSSQGISEHFVFASVSASLPISQSATASPGISSTPSSSAATSTNPSSSSSS